MKHLTKIMTLILALVLAVSFTATNASAEEGYKVEINNDKEGFTYVAYQIIAGDISADVLTNPTFGSAIKDDYLYQGKDAMDTMNYLATLKNDSDELHTFAKEIMNGIGRAHV